MSPRFTPRRSITGSRRSNVSTTPPICSPATTTSSRIRPRRTSNAELLSPARVAPGGAPQQHGSFGDVLGERGRAAEFLGRLAIAAEPRQQVTADAGQVVVPGQRPLAGQPVDDLQPPLRAE